MKYLSILLFLYLFTVVNSNGQHSIVDNGMEKLWHVTYFGNMPGEFDKCYITKIFKFDEEVEFGDTIYVSIYETLKEDLTDWDLIGYMREEDGKVFFLPLTERPEYSDLPEGKEYLLYDFSLLESSTITITNPIYDDYEGDDFTVSNIDSIEINGNKRKRIILTSYSVEEVWIEGIGSLKGLIYSGLPSPGPNRKLTCYSENSETIYKNPEYNFCFCDTALANSQLENKIRLCPNPADGTIKISGVFNATFSLYNSLGKLVKKQAIDETSKVIDISNQKNGVYLYTIHSKNIYIAKKIFVIKQ